MRNPIHAHRRARVRALPARFGTSAGFGAGWRTLLGAVLALAVASLAAAPADDPPATPPSATPLVVFVTVPPVQDLVRRIGGERVDVQVLVGPGHDPHTYEPTPRQVAALAGAALWLRVGMPFEDAWLARISAANPTLGVVDLRNGLPLRPAPEDHDDDDHGHGHGADATDPHIWTSPALARRMAVTIADALASRDPAGAADYARRRAELDAELAGLEQELAATLGALRRRSFLIYHPAFGYLADAYGLTQVPIEQAGKEPGPRALAGLIDQARTSGARLVLVQPQFDPRAAASVATAIGGRVETVDVLGPDYFTTLRRLATLLKAADADADAPAP